MTTPWPADSEDIDDVIADMDRILEVPHLLDLIDEKREALKQIGWDAMRQSHAIGYFTPAWSNCTYATILTLQAGNRFSITYGPFSQEGFYQNAYAPLSAEQQQEVESIVIARGFERDGDLWIVPDQDDAVPELRNALGEARYGSELRRGEPS